MKEPQISVVIPTRNEGRRLADTIRTLADARSRQAHTQVEIVVVDDCSNDDSFQYITSLSAPKLTIKVVRLRDRLGVPRARNAGAAAATAPILFMTDAHVGLSKDWDSKVLNTINSRCVLAATIADASSAFRGYGCSLVVPFMGTRWNREPLQTGDSVQIPSSAGTALTRQLFESIGGYDSGMVMYGFAEPEFGVRAWLSGAEVVSVPDVIVWHQFKSASEIDNFLLGLRPSMVHNALRFGLLYLSQPACLQMIRHYSQEFGKHMPAALRMLQVSDVWARRERLQRTLHHDFRWFAERFVLKDQAGGEILF